MLRLTLYILIWLGSMGLAIFSSQNINPVTIKFLSLESIKLPIGLVLIFCAGLGAVALTLMMTFFTSVQSINNNSQFHKIFSSSFNSSTKPDKTQSNNPEKNTKNEIKNNKYQYKNNPNNNWDSKWSDEWD